MKGLFSEFKGSTLQEWNDKIIADLKGKSVNSLFWQNPDHIDIPPVFHQESLPKLKGDTTHHHSNWEIEQSLYQSGNKNILKSLNEGATALLLGDIPAHEMEKVLENVLIQHIQTSFHYSSEKDSFDEFIKLIQKRKLEPNSIRGSLHYDPLMDSLKKGGFQRDLWDQFRFIQNKVNGLPKFKGICIQGHEYHNAGGTVTQELAFTLAQISEYFACDSELKSTKIRVSLGISTNYFFEIAKFRAMRILWSEILKAYQKEDSELDLRAETGKRNATLYDPHVNLLRATSQAMSAALGGANIINIHSYNASFKKQNQFGERLSRNISLILKEEAQLNRVSDPSAGSYYIEYLTDELSQNAWKLFKEIEANGGWIKCVQKNVIQDSLEESATQQEKSFTQGKLSLLGTNLFPNENEKMAGELEISLEDRPTDESDFKTIKVSRLSTQIDRERIAKEGNHA